MQTKPQFVHYTPYNKDFDPINPSHYQIGGVETIDYIEARLTPGKLIVGRK